MKREAPRKLFGIERAPQPKANKGRRVLLLLLLLFFYFPPPRSCFFPYARVKGTFEGLHYDKGPFTSYVNESDFPSIRRVMLVWKGDD